MTLDDFLALAAEAGLSPSHVSAAGAQWKPDGWRYAWAAPAGAGVEVTTHDYRSGEHCVITIGDEVEADMAIDALAELLEV